MARGRAKLEWDQTSLLWALLANTNRDLKEQPEPFLPSQVHPYRTAADYESEDKDKKARDSIKRTGKITRLKHVGIADRSWPCVPKANNG